MVKESRDLPAKVVKSETEKSQPRTYATDIEKKAMKENNPSAIQVLKKFISELPNHKYLRAYEAACGAGELSRDLLYERYTHVRMFDRSADAKEDAENNTINFDNVEFIEQCRMQDYKFEDLG